MSDKLDGILLRVVAWSQQRGAAMAKNDGPAAEKALSMLTRSEDELIDYVSALKEDTNSIELQRLSARIAELERLLAAAQHDHANVRAENEALRKEAVLIMADAAERCARDVCMYCGRRALGYGDAIGPNQAGNWIHRSVSGTHDALCDATGIWARRSHERAAIGLPEGDQQ